MSILIAILVPSQYQSQVTGKLTVTLKYGTKEAKENIFVVKKLQRAPLGRPGIESLNLIARINSLQDDKFVTMYPNLFKGLGTTYNRRVPYKFARRSQAFCTLNPQESSITSYA